MQLVQDMTKHHLEPQHHVIVMVMLATQDCETQVGWCVYQHVC